MEKPPLYPFNGRWVTLDVMETLEDRNGVRKQLKDVLRVSPLLGHNSKKPAPKKAPRKEQP